MNKSNEIYCNKLGRIYYLKHILETLLIKLLSSLSTKHIKNNDFQVAIFAFDGIGTTINVKGIYEREHLETAMGWLQANNLIKGSAIDVGANIGNHSLYFSKYYHQVFSFEPNPKTFNLLEINSKLAKNIKPINFGLSNINGSVEMLPCLENMGGSKIVDNPKKTSSIIKIEVKTLDSIAHEITSPIGLIKFDVEGHEYNAIYGAQTVIKANKPIILFEQNTADFKDGDSQTIGLLKSIGYDKFATIMPTSLMPMWTPRFLKSVLTLFIRLTIGFSYKISINNNIAPGFYSFIIAIPK
jgi:FkbM family methyltransferase